MVPIMKRKASFCQKICISCFPKIFNLKFFSAEKATVLYNETVLNTEIK